MDINNERLLQYFKQFSAIGATPGGGVHRLALSDEDKQARDLFVELLHDLGAEVKIDDLGNIYGIKQGTNPEAEPVVIGSHLDSVPNGGKYDGAVGVLGALEVLATLVDAETTHQRTLIIVNFTNEEGARFPKPMIASGVLAGVYTTEDMHSLQDESGTTIREELERINYLGAPEHRLTNIDSFIELHIEQGPYLINENAHIGLVQGIHGLSWHDVKFTGKSDHAGPSPMKDRRDAGLSAMHALTRVEDYVLNLQDETRFTTGRFQLAPGVVNAVPGEARFSIDIRHPLNDTLKERIETIQQMIEDEAARRGVKSEMSDLSYMPPVPFSTRLLQAAERITSQKNIDAPQLYSGAGHDAMYMSHLGETLMLFIPSLDGVSHNEQEESRWEDIVTAVDVLGDLVLEQLNR
ncbi:N-carbamoyl-L-amino-acid hydrolase [Salsuginibacillus halophilus]|uniref:N-carbamoyl-L-amino-acid hydrolase n=1 Tax=Salsuginibacillus halophilus TaxID=517424 RepID=A0A2P8H9Q7_9BACI|nr:M20 family metallo-hydrolase [Salsuginibacillus halophilus]PSL42944.1 N-carbamoyl-L-amino-acid hydrolase [Salsuginibacillus halophilus]